MSFFHPSAKTRKEAIRYIKFSLVGATNSSIEAFLFWLVRLIENTRWFRNNIHLQPNTEMMLAQAISYSVMCCNSYLLNRKFTFKSKGKIFGHEAARFAAVCLITLICGSFFIDFLSVTFHLHGTPTRVWAAKLLTMTFSNVTDFVGARLYAFRGAVKSERSAEALPEPPAEKLSEEKG